MVAANVITQQASAAHSALKSLAETKITIYNCVVCVVGRGSPSEASWQRHNYEVNSSSG